MYHRPITSLLLGTAAILAGLLLVAGLWWRLPAWPVVTATKPGGDWLKLMVSADGQTLLGVQQGRLFLFDTDTLRIQASCPFQYFPQGEAIEQFWLSADGRRVVFLDESADLPIVKLWNRDLQEEPITLPDCWSIRETLPASSTLITWGKGGYCLWDLHTAKRLALPIADGEAIRALRQLLDGRIIGIEESRDTGWLASEDGLRVWDFSYREKPVFLRGAQPPAVIAPNGRLVATDSGERVQLWDPKNGQVSAVLARPAGSKEMTAREFSPDGSRLVTQVEAKGYHVPAIWDVSVLPPSHLAYLPGGAAPWPAFSPDGRYLGLWWLGGRHAFSLTLNWGLEVYDGNGQQHGKIRDLLFQRPVFSPDGNYLMGETIDVRLQLQASWLDRLLNREPKQINIVRLWEAPYCRAVASFEERTTFTYFPDSTSLAIARTDGTLEVWPIPPRRPLLIDYGLPVLFVFLVLLGIWRILRAWRAIPQPAASDVQLA